MNCILRVEARCRNFQDRLTGSVLDVFLGEIVLNLNAVCRVGGFCQATWKMIALYSLLVFLPMLSLTVRRLHDTNRSAWWLG